MINLKEIDSKKEITKEFFQWLFDKEEVELTSEIDFSLCPYYNDPYIYYPNEIKNFFETKAMKRLGKIGQLGLTLSKNENSYHTRLEHSKGTYNRKLEELIMLYQNDIYRKHIEDNNMKLYLIAELIKEAGHDIGHLPLSHIMEIQLIQKRNFHEDIGKRILNENEEIQNILKNIDSKLPEILKESLNFDILNSKAHDESNFDVDRLDYLNRDALYLGKKIHLSNEPYKILYAETDLNGNIKKNPDGSIVISNNSNSPRKRIDVYECESLSKIELFLKERVKAYKNIYYSEETQVRDSSVGLFVNSILEKKPEGFNEFKDFIEHLKNSSYKEINLDEYLSWNDFKFYKNCIEVAQDSDNKNFTDFASIIIPPLDNLMTFTHQSLQLNNNSIKTLTDDEIEFILKIKELINTNSELSQNLKNKNFFYSNAYFYNPSQTSDDLLKKYGSIIHTSSATVTGYNSSEPIYVKDLDGKIYSLDEHPKRSANWKKSNETVNVTFILLPELREKGLDDYTIKNILNNLEKENKKEGSYTEPTEYNQLNLSPLQTGHSMKKVFEEIEI